MISLRNITKRYSGIDVVSRLNLDVQTGQTLAIVGPSGCGKSTTLRIVLGLISADQGTVTIEGHTLDSRNLLHIRRMVGYVIQHGGLFPHLTVLQNLTLASRNSDWDRFRVLKRVRELLDLVRLDDRLLRQFPNELSGGQRQRVALCRALMLDPPCLVFDEPLGALDPVVRNDLQVDLRAIFRALSKTVLIVTHDLYEADFLADEIAVMNDGELIQKGRIAYMLHEPANDFVSRFISAQRREWSDDVSRESSISEIK